MAQQYNAPKGTHDLLGESAQGWERLTRHAHDLFMRYGYAPIYTPIFEHTEVFARGIGDATDVVNKEMYTFEDKGGRSITLRPENTASVVRAVINANSTSNGRAAKLYYAGPMFRYERPQQGRQRQFYQVGAEALGLTEPEADAEMIIMLWEFFTTLGIPASSMRLLVNSMGDDACRPAYRDQVRDYILEHASDLCEECRGRAETNPLRSFDCKKESCRAVMAGAPRISEELCADCAAHFARVKELLDAANIPYTEDYTLVRGLDYYTRTVFEIQVADGLGSQSAIGGGGRYDGLFEQLGGKPTPGIGFALGFERTLLALKAAGVELGDATGVDVYLAVADDAYRDQAFAHAQTLRRAGISVLTDVARKSLKAQFKQADHAGARYVAIFAPDEMARGEVRLRDMATKEESLIALDKLEAQLKDA